MTRSGVLVLDDDPQMGPLLAEMLEGIAIRVDVALDLKMACDLLSLSTYQLLLSELNLADGSGLDLLAFIRAQGLALPLILMTSFPTADVRNRVLRAGALDILEKPFSVQAARNLCRRVLGSLP